MRRFCLSGLALVGLGCGGLFGTAEPIAQAPAPIPLPPPGAGPDGAEETVRALYAAYVGTEEAVGHPWLRIASEDLTRQWYTAVKQAEDGCGLAPIYATDVVVDGHDYDITEVTVDALVDGERATVTAGFKNFGRPTVVVFDLILEDDAWRIDEVKPEDITLRKRIFDTVVAADGC